MTFETIKIGLGAIAAVVILGFAVRVSRPLSELGRAVRDRPPEGGGGGGGRAQEGRRRCRKACGRARRTRRRAGRTTSPLSRRRSPPMASGSSISPMRRPGTPGRRKAAGCTRRRTSSPALTRVSSIRSRDMQRKFRISVDGRRYEVVVEEIAARGRPGRRGPARSRRHRPLWRPPRRRPLRPCQAGGGRRRRGRAARRHRPVGRRDGRPGGQGRRQDRDDRGDEDEDRGARQGRRQGRRRSRSSPAIPSTPAPSCSRSPEGADPMTMPDTLYGAFMLSLIDFFMSMVMITRNRRRAGAVPAAQPARQGRRRGFAQKPSLIARSLRAGGASP